MLLSSRGMLLLIGVCLVTFYVTYDTKKTDNLKFLLPPPSEFGSTIFAMTSLAFRQGKTVMGVLCLAPYSDCTYWLQFVAFASDDVTFIVETRPVKDATQFDTTVIIASSTKTVMEIFKPEEGYLWSGNAMHLIILLDKNPGYDVLGQLWKKYWIYRSMLLTSSEPKVVYTLDVFRDSYRRYRRSNRRSIGAIFERSFHDLHYETVRIILFHHKPTSALLNKKDKTSADSYIGLDVSMAQGFAKYMNFKPKIQGTSDKVRYGAAFDNGTLTGTIADLADRKADIAFNGHFTLNFSDKVQLSAVYSYDFVCIVVPKSGFVPKWRSLLKPFDVHFVIATIVVVLSIAVVVRLIRYANLLPSRHYFDEAIFFSTLISMPIYRTPSTSYYRIVLLSCAIWSVVVVGAFQGFLVNALTVPLSYPDINTLVELAGSKLPILSSYKTLDLFPAQKRLRKKLVFVDDVEESSMKKEAWTGKKSNLHLKIKPFHHIMKECPQMYFLSYVVPAGSPFLEYLNRYIHALHAAGLVSFWENHKNNSAPIPRSEDRDDNRVFSIEDLQAPFLLLAFCHVVSICVFIKEIVKRKCRCRKKRTEVQANAPPFTFLH